MDEKLKKLKNFNLIMGFFHLIQGLAMLFLATTVIQKNSWISTNNYTVFPRIQPGDPNIRDSK